METKTTGGDASCLNGNNELHNIRIQSTVRELIIDINQHEDKCWCSAETPDEVYRWKVSSSGSYLASCKIKSRKYQTIFLG